MGGKAFNYSNFKQIHGGWEQFELNGFLEPFFNTPSSNLKIARTGRNSVREVMSFMRPLNTKTDDKTQTKFKDTDDSYGIGYFSNYRGQVLGGMSTPTRYLMMNSVIDEFAKAKRNMRLFTEKTGREPSENIGLYDEIPLAAGFVILQFGFMRLNDKIYGFKETDIASRLGEIKFEEAVAFVASGKVSEIDQWVGLLEQVRQNPDQYTTYNTKTLLQLLSTSSTIEAAEAAFRVHSSLLDALLGDI